MWKAAAGGGLLTAGTAAIKLAVSHAGLPPFVGGLVGELIYAMSFVLIQSCHFVLATKQPSATAATFADVIRNTRGEARWNELARHVAQIFRSQIAGAALGNILGVAVDRRAVRRHLEGIDWRPLSVTRGGRVRGPRSQSMGKRHHLLRRSHGCHPLVLERGGRLD